MFLIEGDVLHAELNTNKYRDYINDRITGITGNCLSNLLVGFMRKNENVRYRFLIFTMILEYSQ